MDDITIPADPQKGGRRPESELTTRFYFRVKT